MLQTAVGCKKIHEAVSADATNSLSCLAAMHSDYEVLPTKSVGVLYLQYCCEGSFKNCYEPSADE